MNKELDKQYYSEITPPSSLVHLELGEIWRFRELLMILVWRDLKVRYKQTFLGIIWALIQPVTTMVIFTIIFGGVINTTLVGLPYPLFLFSGLIYWNYFSTALSMASNSLVSSEGIITKIYFPRLILPISSTISPLLDFLLSLGVFLSLMIYFGQPITLVGVLSIPILIFVSVVTCIGLGALFSAVNVKYRDVRYALPFIIQTLMFITPVLYPVTLVPKELHWLLALNPLYGVITLSRGLFFPAIESNPIHILLSFASGAIILVIGIAYFRKTERFFADVI